jgi:hypothetical protein
MTDLRRQHLRSGLLELYNRKIVMAGETAENSTRRQNERSRLITQPPREDERLTNTSIPSTMRPTHGSSSASPNTLTLNSPTTALALHARKTAHISRQNSQKSTARLDALHTLYMHARTFITTEKQLAVEIDRVFDNHREEWGDTTSDGTSIWNREPPATIATLLQEATSERDAVGLSVLRGNTQRYRADQARMKRLAEVLSGGKM